MQAIMILYKKRRFPYAVYNFAMAFRNLVILLVLVVQVYEIQGCYEYFNDYCMCRGRRREIMAQYDGFYKEYEANSVKINESLTEFQPWVEKTQQSAESLLGLAYYQDLVDYRSVILRRCGCRPYYPDFYPIWRVPNQKKVIDYCSWLLVQGPRLCSYLDYQRNFWTCDYRVYFKIIFIQIWEVYSSGSVC